MQSYPPRSSVYVVGPPKPCSPSESRLFAAPYGRRTLDHAPEGRISPGPLVERRDLAHWARTILYRSLSGMPVSFPAPRGAGELPERAERPGCGHGAGIPMIIA